MRRTLALLAALALAVPPPAPAAEAGRFCEAYCETMLILCSAAANVFGGQKNCVELYEGCRDGCNAPV